MQPAHPRDRQQPHLTSLPDAVGVEWWHLANTPNGLYAGYGTPTTLDSKAQVIPDGREDDELPGQQHTLKTLLFQLPVDTHQTQSQRKAQNSLQNAKH